MNDLFREENLLFYDIECFKNDALVIICDKNMNIVFKEWNNFDNLRVLVREHCQKGFLIGYNNYFYDDYVLTAMMINWEQFRLKELNDWIISGNKPHIKISPFIRSLDCFQQIDPSRPSLKYIQANMGINIHETTVSFDIDRPLNQEEKELTELYCLNDIRTTIEIFDMRYQYFESKFALLDLVKEPKPNMYRWNTTTISANIVNPNNNISKWNKLYFGNRLYDDLTFAQYFKDTITQDMLHLWNGTLKSKKKTVTTENFNNKIDWGKGGLHGVTKKKQKRFDNCYHLDVASMYPNIMRILNVFGSATQTFNSIVEERVEAKKNGDKLKAETLKLVVNSAYGLTNLEYSSLYNPKASLSITIFGQLVIHELAERLSRYSEIIQVNTDGVIIIPHEEKGIEYIRSQWEEMFDMKLDSKEIQTLFQRDINNYFIIQKNGYSSYKGEVKRYAKNEFFKNNSLRIVDIGIVDFLTKGKTPIETVTEYIDSGNALVFQNILKTGPTYQGTIREDGSFLTQKINRAFVTKDGEMVYKLKKDGTRQVFDLLPPCTIHNDDVSTFDLQQLDKQYYVDLIQGKLKKWL